MRIWYRSAFHNAVAFVTFGCVTKAPVHAAQTISAVRPLQTELLLPLDLAHVHIGGTVFARVDFAWADAGCVMNAGSIIKGRIVDLTKRSKFLKDSAIQVAFDDADCKGAYGSPHRFTLVALVGRREGSSSNGQSGVSGGPPLSSDLPQTIGGAGGGIRNADIASSLTSGLPIPAPHLPSQILPGQVVDLPRVRLVMGAESGGATAITAVGRDLRLEAGTFLIFVPASSEVPANDVPHAGEAQQLRVSGTGRDSMVPGKKAATARPGEIVPPLQPVEPQDETEVCSGACTMVGGTGTGAAVQASLTGAGIRLDSLGYQPTSNRELAHFGTDTTVTYLDAQNLLCTFDPHFLRKRTGANEDAVRTIRAVLIDPSTHLVKRVIDWHARGDGQYLWRLFHGRILVYMRHELREFSADLKPLRSIPIGGRLAWVAASPLGDFVAVGTIQELYSEGIRQELEETLAEDPEERVEVRVFDKDLHLLLSGARSSKMATPVLTDSGELRVHPERGSLWKVSEIRWDRIEHTIANIQSACRPVLSTPVSGLIFALGCTATGGHWYRVFRDNGHPLLKADSPSTEIEQSAQGAMAGDFVIRTVETVNSMNYNQPFRPSDLIRETITIYSGANGAHLVTVTSADFAYSQLAFALSPAGDQLALAGHDTIRFYKVK